MYGFRDKEVLLQAGYEVIVIFLRRGAARNFVIVDFDFILELHCNYTCIVHLSPI